jgi:putative transposase
MSRNPHVGSVPLLSFPLLFTLLFSFLSTLRSCFQTRAALQLEILALRHQINVLRRSQRGRVRLTEVDRLLWPWLLQLWSSWRSALIIVKPETVMAWHRRGFRLYGTGKSRQGKPGRPEVSREVRHLIRKMSRLSGASGTCHW